MHPYYVRPYRRRNKTDSEDADALVRANKDPHLRPVPTKSPEQQALQGIHRARLQLIKTRTQRINLARSLATEYGVTLPRATGGLSLKLTQLAEELPKLLVPTFFSVIDDIDAASRHIDQLDRKLNSIARQSGIAMRLMTIPGVGTITATALIASVPDIHQFRKGRQFAAWLGITPREHSSGNTQRLGRISKQGNEYLRTLLIHGSRSVMLQAYRRKPEERDLIHHWIINLEERKHRNIVAVATANKLARTVWATWVSEKPYSP